MIEKKEFPPDRKRLLPLRVVKNYRELLLVVDQRKAWEKRTSSVHQSHPAKGDKDPARRISFSFYTQFRKSLVDRIHSQEEFK